MPTLELYTLPGCPYCAKVKRKLAALDLEYEEHRVPLRHSKRETVKELSGQTGVPVLVDHDHDIRGMAESEDIIEHLESAYGS